MWRKRCVWRCNSTTTVPCATFSYCPLDEAECSTVWKRLDMADIPLCSEPLPVLSLKVDNNPLLLAKPFWFSLFAIAANRMRFGFGSWNISCQIENKLRWESFWPISMDWTCSNHTRPCRLWINCRDEIKSLREFVPLRKVQKLNVQIIWPAHYFGDAITLFTGHSEVAQENGVTFVGSGDTLESFRFQNENDYEYEIFSVVNSARAWASVILAGKRGSRRHFTTSFSENVLVSEVLSFYDLERVYSSFTKGSSANFSSEKW